MINTYIIVTICAYTANAHYNSRENFINVGSVLFTIADLDKKRWDRTDIELLEARRQFQNLIPPPRSIDTSNENYVGTLLGYFKNAVSIAKREVKRDPALSDVMERALSDVIGGFLKVWVLPVTKFAYYGGTVSQENAVKAYQYYEDIKRSLKTNGTGWKNPSDAILNSIAISVVPYSHETFRRSMKDNPCEHLAYYEKYNNGLTIPTPYINWVDKPSTMFLPLKNGSLILLDSPNSSNALLNYYNIAESCSHANNPNGCNEFDERFQNWLSTDVVPHLNDDKLYVAFGSVLGLMNETKQLFQKVPDDCDQDYEAFRDKSILAGFPPSITSKKFLILSFVLFLEIIWCIPTLLYMCLYSRKVNKTNNRTQFFLDIFRRRKFGGGKCQTIGRSDNSGTKGKHYQPRMFDTGLKLIQKPKIRITEVNTQCPSHTSKRSVGQVTETFSDIDNANTTDSVTIIHEKPMKSSLKKKDMESNTMSSIKLKNSSSCTTEKTTPTCSFATVQNLDATITKTLIKSKISSDKKLHSIVMKKNNSTDKESIRKNSEERKEENNIEPNDTCPCMRCIDEDMRNAELASKNNNYADVANKQITNNETDHLQHMTRIKKYADTIKRTRLPKLKKTRICAPQDFKANKNKGFKLNAGEPTLEIRIDRPAAEIKVDVTKCNGNARAKPSKIPRRTAICNAMENYEKNLVLPTAKDIQKRNKYKLVEKRSADDNFVRKAIDKRNKLNITL